ncbi:MAG TPA: hypothetical protein VJR89_15545 [Polyangiales bacterium]|nr:hypothetical protein [Polyangiales bacterium]
MSPASTAPPSASNPADSPASVHARLRGSFEAEVERLSALGNRYSLIRLATFLGAVTLLITGFVQHSTIESAIGGALAVAFLLAVGAHARTITAEQRARIRRDIHARQLARLSGEWHRFPNTGADLIAPAHAYAGDIDVVGQGSLFQRIDVSHTVHGERTLSAWLASAADPASIRARQDAVWELAPAVELRQELEAAGSVEPGARLDPRGLDALARLTPLFASRPWLRVVIYVLPACTLAAYVCGLYGIGVSSQWLLPALLQVLLLASFGKAVRRALDLVSARAPLLAAFEDMLVVLERAKFSSAALIALQKRVSFGDRPPSTHMRRLARWAGFAELRQQRIFHVVVNPLTLWDLHVLYGLERFVRDVGSHSAEWFDALGELEALSSLAGLAYLDESAIRPELADPGTPFEARGLAHPLLQPSVRVVNDVRLRGPGTALVVTGSNMAGKSTLLRAVGQNIALALAGGPVIAEHMVVPLVRLRASMRADDSLESGASYFHAELTKLKRVIEHAETGPPVFFLLDELLRGTNARARHIGAKAVLLHLLERGATGLCATHDVELAALGDSDPTHIENVHFTDVVLEGEMRFDYKLRPGIVRTSNALRLLAMAGISVPEHDRQDQQQAPPLPAREVGEGAR